MRAGLEPKGSALPAMDGDGLADLEHANLAFARYDEHHLFDAVDEPDLVRVAMPHPHDELLRRQRAAYDHRGERLALLHLDLAIRRVIFVEVVLLRRGADGEGWLDLIDELRGFEGGEVTIGIVRDKKESTLKATIEESPRPFRRRPA